MIVLCLTHGTDVDSSLDLLHKGIASYFPVLYQSTNNEEIFEMIYRNFATMRFVNQRDMRGKPQNESSVDLEVLELPE